MSVLRNSRGITLVEIAVSVSILSFVTITLFAMVSHSLTGWSSGTTEQISVNAATLAMEKLTKDIRDGRSAVVSSDRLIVTFPARITDVFTHESIYDPSNNDPVTRTYFFSNGNLYRQLGSTTPMVLVRDITSAAFEGSGGRWKITLKSKTQVGTKKYEQVVIGRVALRNFRN